MFVFESGICRCNINAAIVNNYCFTFEQESNYYKHDSRIRGIIDMVFPDSPCEEKYSWRMLLLGTVAVESNFLDRYAGKSQNGNGPYQIIADTVYGVIHRYITYPVKDNPRMAVRNGLIPLFERATGGRVKWDILFQMSKAGLIELCVNDHDFAALISLLVYKDAFERDRVAVIPRDIAALACLWKKYYNTDSGMGRCRYFIDRFLPIYCYLTPG
jgi:hypothetical protein